MAQRSALSCGCRGCCHARTLRTASALGGTVRRPAAPGQTALPLHRMAGIWRGGQPVLQRRGNSCPSGWLLPPSARQCADTPALCCMRTQEGRILWGAVVRRCRDGIRLAAAYAPRSDLPRMMAYLQAFPWALKVMFPSNCLSFSVLEGHAVLPRSRARTPQRPACTKICLQAFSWAKSQRALKVSSLALLRANFRWKWEPPLAWVPAWQPDAGR